MANRQQRIIIDQWCKKYHLSFDDFFICHRRNPFISGVGVKTKFGMLLCKELKQ